MKFYILLLIVALLNSANGKALHERKRRVAGNDNYYEDLDKPVDNDADDFYGEDGDYEYDEDYDDYGEMFACFEGSVEIAISLLCDGFHDCADGSDEVIANCEEHGKTLPTTTTTSTTTTTTTTAQTLPPVEPKISKPEDYDDYGDACSEEEYQCVSDVSICLPKSQVCDGIHDCPDKEDEENCNVPLENFDYFDGVIPDVEIPKKKKKFEFNVQNLFDINPGSQDLKSTSFDYLNNLDKDKEGVIVDQDKYDSGNGIIVQMKPRPPIVILKQPEESDFPIFVPKVQKNDMDDLALESNFQYKRLDEMSNEMVETPSVSGTKVDVVPSEETTAATVIKTDGEIEINHETGEITLYKNGQPIKVTEEDFAINDQSEDILTTRPQVKNLDTEITLKPNVGILKAKKRIEKQGKKLRGIVSELLHHVGKIVETGGSPESEDLIHTDINVNIGTGADLSVDSLYSRILSGASRPRLSINVKLQL